MDRYKRVLLLLLLRHRRNKRRNQKRFWISPVIALRNSDGQFFMQEYRELLLDEDKFFAFFRMSVASFNYLVITLEPHLKKQYTNFRNPIEPIEMIGITVR